MIHLGSVTDVDGGKIAPVDIISFGSPCQDLSQAGKRAGLAGERSGLFNEAVRIIREMQSATAGEYPRLAIWENVPGAFSSNKGRDFACVIESLVGAAVSVPEEGWPSAGVAFGPLGQLAWRVLDAQHFGVPQRRRRIFAVLDTAGERAGEILLKREGVSGDSAESGEAREGTAEGTGDGVKGTEYLTGWDNQEKRIFTDRGVAPTLSGSDGGGGRTCCGYLAQEIHPKITGTLCASGAGMSRPAGMASETDLLLAQCITTGAGRRYDPETETLIPVAFGPGGQHDIAHALRSQPSKADKPSSTTYVIQSATMGSNKKQNGLGVTDGPCYTLDCRADHAVAHAVDCRNLYETEELSGTLQSKQGGGYSLNYQNPVRVGYRVRRLTPLECERLQGFPDGWTGIEGASDTARYKALGNSVAIPCVSFIMRRIKEVLGLKTLGSLFDGIAGFPLAAQMHGITTLWASEIEPFCIRVSSKHFPEVEQ
jgi:DNA (cytosine-5)-methyltransferase 1